MNHDLSQRLDRLEAENRELKQRVEALEETISPTPPSLPRMPGNGYWSSRAGYRTRMWWQPQER